jgi:plasmid stability protein
MAQLMVRNLSEELVKALKQRAAKHNRSAEQGHREILQAALLGPRRRIDEADPVFAMRKPLIGFIRLRAGCMPPPTGKERPDQTEVICGC